MGDALLGRFAARPARLPGYHRAFLHESRRRWGSALVPCPILGLAPGGECWGVLFDVPEAEGRVVRRALESREGVDERRREACIVETAMGGLPAWVWVSRRAGAWVSRKAEVRDAGVDLAGLETRLRAAHGVVGTGVEYVRTVVHALELHDIHDPLVEGLWERLKG
jgi:cation transport regulator ChaC